MGVLQSVELLQTLLDTLFIDDISIRKHTVKALEYLSTEEDVIRYLVLEQSGLTSGMLNAAKDSAKDSIELSALNVLCSIANQEDLQVPLAHTKNLIDHLVLLLDSNIAGVRSVSKEILTLLSENEELQNVID